MPGKLGIIIPVYNVEATIGRVLSAFTPVTLARVAEILVIDNCSGDRTASIVEGFLEGGPLEGLLSLQRNHRNYGYGRSLKSGFTYFENRGVDHILVLHGDYQVDPDVLTRKFFAALDADPALDLILACRFMAGANLENYNFIRRAGNHFFNLLTCVCSGHWMPDAGTAMILVRPKILKAVPYERLTESMQFHPQLNILFYGLPGIRLREIPLDWQDSDAPSSITIFSYGWVLLKMLLRYRFRKTFLRRPAAEIFAGSETATSFPVTLEGRAAQHD